MKFPVTSYDLPSLRNTLATVIQCAAVLSIGCSASIVSAEDKTCEIAKTAISAASTIRELAIKKSVPCFVQDRDSVRTHIVALVNEKTPAQKMHLEGLAYKAIGFIPDDFNYEKGLIDLYVSQLGGYYDPEHKYFVMAGWMPAVFQSTIAVHEMTHALQDQYFDLEKFMDPQIDNSDKLLARSALVEGDATAVMLDFGRAQAGLGSIAKEPNVNAVMMQNVIGGAMTVSGTGVPQSLQLALLFPYTSGLRFAHQLLLKGDYHAIDEAFRRAPQSTTEILHPERYFDGSVHPKSFTDQELLSAFTDAIHGKVLYHDTVGEFAVSALLGVFEINKDLVVQAADGWNGDRLAIVDEGNGFYQYLWRTSWSTPADADEFFQLYSAALKKKYGAEFGNSAKVQKQGNEVLVFIRRMGS